MVNIFFYFFPPQGRIAINNAAEAQFSSGLPSWILVGLEFGQWDQVCVQSSIQGRKLIWAGLESSSLCLLEAESLWGTFHLSCRVWAPQLDFRTTETSVWDRNNWGRRRRRCWSHPVTSFETAHHLMLRKGVKHQQDNLPPHLGLFGAENQSMDQILKTKMSLAVK